MSEIDLTNRPRPVFAAFRTTGTAVAVLGGVLTSLVGWGVLSTAQGHALSGLLGAVPGVLTVVTALLAAFGVVRVAEPAVTPLSDPVDALGRPLTV